MMDTQWSDDPYEHVEQLTNTVQQLRADLAAARAEIERLNGWRKVAEENLQGMAICNQQLAAHQLVIKQAKKFIFEWDLARSSGEWPYRVLQELREALAVSSTEALDAYVQRAVEQEREWILSIYSPDDSANDYLDKIRGRGK